MQFLKFKYILHSKNNLSLQFKKFLEKFQDYEIEKISQKLENFGKIELDFINFNETEETYVEKSLLSKVINFPKMLIYYK